MAAAVTGRPSARSQSAHSRPNSVMWASLRRTRSHAPSPLLRFGCADSTKISAIRASGGRKRLISVPAPTAGRRSRSGARVVAGVLRGPLLGPRIVARVCRRVAPLGARSVARVRRRIAPLSPRILAAVRRRVAPLAPRILAGVLHRLDRALGRRVGLEPDDLLAHRDGLLDLVVDDDLAEPDPLGAAGDALAERDLLLGAGHRRVRLLVAGRRDVLLAGGLGAAPAVVLAENLLVVLAQLDLRIHVRRVLDERPLVRDADVPVGLFRALERHDG